MIVLERKQTTDFLSEDEAATLSGTLQGQIDAKPDTLLELTDTPGVYDDGKYLKSTVSGTGWFAAVSDHGDLTGLADDDHSQYHNDTRGDVRYYQKSEINTISGSLSSEIDSDISTHEAGDAHDSRYYTETELDNGQLDTRYYTEAEITTISGNIVDQIPSLIGYATESYVDTSSGTLQDEIDNLDYYTQAEVTTISGNIVAQIPTDFYTTGEVDTISGSITDQIPSDYVSDAEITTISGDIIAQIPSIAGLATESYVDSADTTLSGILVAQIPTDYYTTAEVDTISGSLSAEIDSDISTHSLSGDHDSRYYTESEVDALIASASGTTNHALLDNLDYASSGHTGFQPAGDYTTNDDLTTTSGNIIAQIPTDFYTTSEVDTISGSLQTAIDGKSDTSHTHDDRYYTETEITTISGNIVDQIPTDFDDQYYTETELNNGQLDNRYYTESEVDTISGSLQINIDGKSDVQTFLDLTDTPTTYSGTKGKYLRVFDSPYIVPAGDAIDPVFDGDYTPPDPDDVDFIFNMPMIIKFVDLDYYTTTQVDTISGSLSDEIDSDISTHEAGDAHDSRYYTESEVNTISGSLQTAIDGKSDTSHLHDDRYYTEAEVDSLITTISGKLDDHNELNNLDYASSGHTGFQPAGDYTTNDDLTITSGTLQGQIDTNISDISTNVVDISNNTTLIGTTSGTLQGQITTNTGDISTNTENISNNTTNIATVSGVAAGNTTDITTNTADIAQNTTDIITVSGSIITDHGALTGLSDDDHPQYIKDTEFTQSDTVLTGTGAGTFEEKAFAVNVASSIHGVASKETPVDADEIGGIDTEASNVLKKHTWTNIKAFLKTYFDTLYNLYSHPNHSGDVTSDGDGATSIGADKVKDTHIDWGIGEGQVNSDDIPDHNGHSIKETFDHIVDKGKATVSTITLTSGLGISWIEHEIYDSSTKAFIIIEAGSGDLADNTHNYLKWVSGTTATISTSTSAGDEILLAAFSVYDGIINGYRETSLINETLSNTRKALRELFPTYVISGISVYEDTDVTNTFDVTMDAGVFWKDGIEKKTTVEIKSRNTAMVRHFHTGGVWDSDTNVEIDVVNYDNGTGLVAIPANKYTKSLFILMGTKIGWVYPREYFTVEADAIAAALPTVPPGLEHAPKSTAVVLKQNAAAFPPAGDRWQDVRPGISEASFVGITEHSSLSNLGFAVSGHTGFQPAGDYATNAEVATVSGNIVSQIPSLSGYATETYVDNADTTLSGVLQTEIDGKADTGHIHDDRYYTEAEVDTISGSLSAEIDSDISTHAASADHDGRYYTESEVDALEWTESDIIDLDKYSQSEVDTISGSLQTNIDALISDTAYDAGTWDGVSTIAPSKNVVRDQRELDAVSMLRKNAIINGNFDVWQRGVTQSVTGYGSDDRWNNAQTGSSKVHTRQAFTVGQTDVPNEPTYYSRTVVTTGSAASNYVIKKYRMEDVRTFAGKTITLSFYAKADASKDIATEFVQNFGAGGSAGVTAIDVTTHSLTTSWQKFTVTVTMPSISGKTLDTSTYIDINFWLEAGSNYDARTNTLGNQSGTFEIAQVQLEEGTVATAFEYRSYGEELALCQRYFERLEGIGAGTYFSWGAGTQQTTTS